MADSLVHVLGLDTTDCREWREVSPLLQAHARLLAQDEVRETDAVVAVMLVDASMGEAALLSANPMLNASTEDAEVEFQRLKQRLLELIQGRLRICA